MKLLEKTKNFFIYTFFFFFTVNAYQGVSDQDIQIMAQAGEMGLKITRVFSIPLLNSFSNFSTDSEYESFSFFFVLYGRPTFLTIQKRQSDGTIYWFTREKEESKDIIRNKGSLDQTVFLHDTKSPQGVFAITFYKNAAEQQVCVSDLITKNNFSDEKIEKHEHMLMENEKTRILVDSKSTLESVFYTVCEKANSCIKHEKAFVNIDLDEYLRKNGSDSQEVSNNQVAQRFTIHCKDGLVRFNIGIFMNQFFSTGTMYHSTPATLPTTKLFRLFGECRKNIKKENVCIELDPTLSAGGAHLKYNERNFNPLLLKLSIAKTSTLEGILDCMNSILNTADSRISASSIEELRSLAKECIEEYFRGKDVEIFVKFYQKSNNGYTSLTAEEIIKKYSSISQKI